MGVGKTIGGGGGNSMVSGLIMMWQRIGVDMEVCH